MKRSAAQDQKATEDDLEEPAQEEGREKLSRQDHLVNMVR